MTAADGLVRGTGRTVRFARVKGVHHGPQTLAPVSTGAKRINTITTVPIKSNQAAESAHSRENYPTAVSWG